MQLVTSISGVPSLPHNNHMESKRAVSGTVDLSADAYFSHSRKLPPTIALCAVAALFVDHTLLLKHRAYQACCALLLWGIYVLHGSSQRPDVCIYIFLVKV